MTQKQLQQKLAFDFKAARIAFSRCIQQVMPLIDNQPIETFYEEPETQEVPRPTKTYMGFKFTTPAAKTGDDTKSWLLDSEGNPTSIVNTGGVRRMTVDFDLYSTDSHEEAYSMMGTWQTRLDDEFVQAILRDAGIAVWIIGGIADLSQLLNTGWEGRAHMSCQFGIAMNVQSDLGEMDSVQVTGDVKTDDGNEYTVTQTVQGE